jgi:hypothetical protein
MIKTAHPPPPKKKPQRRRDPNYLPHLDQQADGGLVLVSHQELTLLDGLAVAA